MKMGTKSVLFGAHQFAIHPWFVALGWWKLYGFPWDPRLWVCFFVHDLGYFGKPNMDGPEGEMHPILGALIVRKLFGDEWGEFCLLHSRFFARKLNKRYSKLCVADKMAIVVTPSWLYLPFVRATGELAEYMDMQRESKYLESNFNHSTPYEWHQSVKRYIYGWVVEHAGVDRDDSWIKGNATDMSDVHRETLPGYLEGGYMHNKYIVLKRDGSPINVRAKYMVVRYDKDRDPHGIFATLSYAVSVELANAELAEGIFNAIREELEIDWPTFSAKYDSTIDALRLAANAFENVS